LREWVDASYPGRGISIGEYNFGAEQDMSGGLAVAEALGRFAEAGLTSAFYWTAPPRASPAFQAFRAYRDFDGRGARFGDLFLGAASADRLSLFASRDEPARRAVIVAVNARERPAQALLQVAGCTARSARQFSYTAGAAGFEERTAASATAFTLPPRSISSIELLCGAGK
jgi:hypothetical protein